MDNQNGNINDVNKKDSGAEDMHSRPGAENGDGTNGRVGSGVSGLEHAATMGISADVGSAENGGGKAANPGAPRTDRSSVSDAERDSGRIGDASGTPSLNRPGKDDFGQAADTAVSSDAVGANGIGNGLGARQNTGVSNVDKSGAGGSHSDSQSAPLNESGADIPARQDGGRNGQNSQSAGGENGLRSAQKPQGDEVKNTARQDLGPQDAKSVSASGAVYSSTGGLGNADNAAAAFNAAGAHGINSADSVSVPANDGNDVDTATDASVSASEMNDVDTTTGAPVYADDENNIDNAIGAVIYADDEKDMQNQKDADEIDLFSHSDHQKPTPRRSFGAYIALILALLSALGICLAVFLYPAETSSGGQMPNAGDAPSAFPNQNGGVFGDSEGSGSDNSFGEIFGDSGDSGLFGGEAEDGYSFGGNSGGFGQTPGGSGQMPGGGSGAGQNSGVSNASAIVEIGLISGCSLVFGFSLFYMACTRFGSKRIGSRDKMTIYILLSILTAMVVSVSTLLLCGRLILSGGGTNRLQTTENSNSQDTTGSDNVLNLSNSLVLPGEDDESDVL